MALSANQELSEGQTLRVINVTHYAVLEKWDGRLSSQGWSNVSNRNALPYLIALAVGASFDSYACE